jgi:hypothetical protein
MAGRRNKTFKQSFILSLKRARKERKKINLNLLQGFRQIECISPGGLDITTMHIRKPEVQKYLNWPILIELSKISDHYL